MKKYPIKVDQIQPKFLHINFVNLRLCNRLSKDLLENSYVEVDGFTQNLKNIMLYPLLIDHNYFKCGFCQKLPY